MSKYLYDHDCPFEAYITNLGKYNEGELVGEWVKFPVDDEELEEVYGRIGIGEEDEFGQVYEEIFITDYDIYVEGLSAIELGEFANIDKLNELAYAIDNLRDYELKVFAGACCLETCSSADEYISLIDDLDNYYLIEGVENDSELGYYWLFDSGCYSLPEQWVNYIDYEAWGRDEQLSTGGVYTDYGYVYRV